MRHPKLPGQPIIVHAWDESDLTGGNSPQEAAGWRLAKTDPEKIRDEVQATPEPPAEPVEPTKKTKE